MLKHIKFHVKLKNIGSGPCGKTQDAPHAS